MAEAMQKDTATTEIEIGEKAELREDIRSARIGEIAEVREEATRSLRELKMATNERIIFELKKFGDFVETQDLKKIDRRTTLGRFLRIARYGDHLWRASQAHNIPFDYLYALTMVESQGNTASINERDGGAGFVHFQPDVAKEYGMKIFTDTPTYRKYDFKLLRKQGKSKAEIYKIHGKILQGLMGKSMAQLEQIDDRFHTIKCINATARYLSKIKTNYVDQQVDSVCADASRDIYKNDSEYNFGRMLALNGFNKGPNNFDKNFVEGSHVNNVKNNLMTMRKYQSYVAQNLFEGKSYRDVFVGLQKIGS